MSNRRILNESMSKVGEDSVRFKPILKDLNPEQVYLLHVDRHPVPHKQTIFFTAVLINLTVLALLIGRVIYVLPEYTAILFLREWPSDAQSSTFTIIIRRAFSLLFDSLLVQYVWKWPYTFFLERHHEQWANPAAWRLISGFHPLELIVRKSRSWGAEDLGDSIQQSPFFKTRVLPNASDRYLSEKTGYLMQGKDWDLDYAAMIRAARAKLKMDCDHPVLLVANKKGEWSAHALK